LLPHSTPFSASLQHARQNLLIESLAESYETYKNLFLHSARCNAGQFVTHYIDWINTLKIYRLGLNLIILYFYYVCYLSFLTFW